MNDTEYIWIERWDEFQKYQTKRAKPWAPPWIQQHLAQMQDDRYLDLTDRQRALLHDLRMVFAMTRGRLRHDSSTISRYRHRQTRDEDLQALNHAGLISFCSRTVLEHKWNMFWNRSNLDVEVDKNKPLNPNPAVNGHSETPSLPDLDSLLKDMPI